MECNDSLRVQAYFDGELDASASVDVEQHLKTCSACADLLHAYHAVARVADAFDVRFVVGLEEARPARARIELGARAK